MVDWSGYLESICTDYAQWWEVYTLTEVFGKQQRQKQEKKPMLLDFELMVQPVEQEQEKRDREKKEEKERIERLGVLEGLRKYAAEHVLLVGRPGSGKSTALVRLLLEEAQRRREGEEVRKIPVLVELRYYQTSILDLIQNFLKRHQPELEVNDSILENWLRQGQLQLLVDGLNELPSQTARQDLYSFRQNYQKTTPMIFTTRDLGVGGDLNITKKLEMQPLSEKQMQQFVRKYLPQQGEQMLRQLGSRLREFGQTPLLLMMLCSVFDQNDNKVPANLGSVFRQFTQIYSRKHKQDAAVSEESRRWWKPMLEQLAWVMTCGEGKTQLQVAIPKEQGEAVLIEFLQGKVAHPENCALSWLDGLLKHHLIQLSAGDQIEFPHQLLQEYYTAEYFLKLLTSPHPSFSRIGDEELKQEYLNYLKWTESLALMVQLLENEAQAVRVVKLALEVDWMLGARLAGAVKSQFQQQTVGLVVGLEIPQLLKIRLLGITGSESSLPFLIQARQDQDNHVCMMAVAALFMIGTEAAITHLIQALQDENYYVRGIAAIALGTIGTETEIYDLPDQYYNAHINAAESLVKVGTEAAITALITALQDEHHYVRISVAEALGEIGTEVAITALVTALQDEHHDVRISVAKALGKIGTEAAIPALITALQDKKYYVRSDVVESLGEIGTEATILTLQEENYDVRSIAADALGKIGTKAAIPALITALRDENYDVRSIAADALGKIGTETAIPALTAALQDKNDDVRENVAKALGKIGTEAATPALITALQDKNDDVRENAAEALGEIRTEAAIPVLVNALQDKNYDVRSIAAEALVKIGTETVIPALVNALQDEDYGVSRNAAEALVKIGTETAITPLIKALQNEDYGVSRNAAEALVKIGTETAITPLIKALQDEDDGVSRNAAEALVKIGTETAITPLITALQDEKYHLRIKAAKALSKIGIEAAIPTLTTALQHGHYFIRRDAVKSLGEIGTEAVITTLIEALQDEDLSVRREAAKALSKNGIEAAIPTLSQALKDEYYYVRNDAVESLGKIGTEAAIPALITALQDEHHYVRSSAVEALGKIGTETAITALIQALQEQKYRVLVNPEVETLTLQEENYDLRSNAAVALGKIGTKAAIPALITALQDEHHYVRSSAVEALGKIGTETAIPVLIQIMQNEGDDVCRKAVLALGKIGTEAAISALIQALQDERYYVCINATFVLEKIGTEAAINQLVKALKQENFVTANEGETLNYAIDTLEQIQQRCQLYNPTLTQPIPTPEPQPYIPSTQLMYILHLSDLHITNPNQASLWSNQLAEDLRNELDIPQLDALIISGDIANYSTPEEYQAAEQFLHNLRQDFSLEPEQIIIVPGNHDLNWKQAKKAYKLIDLEEYEGELQEGYYIQESATVVRVRDETSYKQRFINFSKFYQAIANQPYPQEYDQQGILYHLPQQNLLFLGLNSAWQLDHHYKSRASINMNALSNALTEIRRNRNYDNCLKIAVWHHPLISAYEDRITDSAFLDQLAVAGFRFFLHGHIHEAETSNYRYDMSKDGRNLDQICAGTFGAPTQELVTGTPWQYNLLQFEPDKLTVRTRRRTKENGAWEADSIWRQGRGTSSLDYYTIRF
ncbi:MAG: NACHT domain-containing protein [Symploca sp. SIO1B1]|nr:NACHT domain-containing protein [Symploca sp. SIO1B1]